MIKMNAIFKTHGTALIAMSSRVTSAVGWLLGMFMVVHYLTPVETGFYYAFQSLVALQVFLEMGMATVIIIRANQEVAYLTWDNQRWNGDSRHVQRLGSIVRLVKRWYGLAGLSVLLIITPVGIIFFSRQNTAAHPVAWLGPWIALGFAAGLSVIFVGLEALTEGMGSVSELAQSRLAQAIFALLVFIVALRMGAGLWASSLMVAGRVFVGTYLIWKKCGCRLQAIMKEPKGEKVDWRRDLLPFQWKIALSWISGYAIFQIMTPFVFAYSGPTEAGRFGLAVQATAGVGSVAGAWLQVRQAYWAQGAARRDWAFLERDFRAVASISIGLSLVGCTMVGGMILIGKYYGVVNRLPSWGVYIPFAIAICINQYIFAMATYLRAFFVEPFLLQSILMALTISIGTLFLRHQPPFVLAWWYCGVTGTLGLWMGQWVFHRWRKHNQSLG